MILSGLKYICALIFLTAAGLIVLDKVLLPLYVGFDNEHYVPDLRHYDSKSALMELQTLGFHVELITKPFVEDISPGTVLALAPRQFTKVKEGRTIKLTVAGDRTYMKVPDVTGKTIRNARFEIQRNHLVVDSVYYEYNTTFRKDQVISQMPQAGDLKLSGFGVNLFVSKGKPPDYFLVPDLTNLSQSKAEKLILQEGFQIGEIKYDYQPNLVRGTVVEQSLTPGMKLSFPARINIYISTDIKDYE